MARKGENIYKRKDGRWEGRYIKSKSLAGKSLYGYVYAKSYREVKQKLVESRAKSELSVGDNRGKELIFSDIAEEWLILRKPQLKASTCMKYKNLLNTYIFPFLGEMPLSSITCDNVKEFCNTLLSSGGSKGTGLSSKTVSDVLSLLRNIFKYSSESGNAFVCDISSVTIKQSPKELRILSRSEEEKLYQFLHENPDLRSIGILLCLFTGIRIGELCALQWEDFSFKENTVHIWQTMQRIQTEEQYGKKTKVIITPPKSHCSVRTIPLPKSLAEILESYYGLSGYFLTGTENIFIEPRTMQNYFKAVLKECNIKTANFHALRHTFATRCVELGVDVKSLSEILGHSNVSITMNRYVHPSIDLKRENMERLAKLFAVK